jgi:hypothetical protein
MLERSDAPMLTSGIGRDFWNPLGRVGLHA